eukprot:g82029.t1
MSVNISIDDFLENNILVAHPPVGLDHREQQIRELSTLERFYEDVHKVFQQQAESDTARTSQQTKVLPVRTQLEKFECVRRQLSTAQYQLQNMSQLLSLLQASNRVTPQSVDPVRHHITQTNAELQQAMPEQSAGNELSREQLGLLCQSKAQGLKHLAEELKGGAHLAEDLKGGAHLAEELKGGAHLAEELKGVAHLAEELKGGAARLRQAAQTARQQTEELLRLSHFWKLQKTKPGARALESNAAVEVDYSLFGVLDPSNNARDVAVVECADSGSLEWNTASKRYPFWSRVAPTPET